MGLFVYVNLIVLCLYILITYQSVAVYIMLHVGLKLSYILQLVSAFISAGFPPQPALIGVLKFS